MIIFEKNRVEDAAKVLEGLGFRRQHQRIFQLSAIAEGNAYQVMVGLEDVEEDTYALNLSIVVRPGKHNKKEARMDDVRVVDAEQAPQSIQDILYEVESQIEAL